MRTPFVVTIFAVLILFVFSFFSNPTNAAVDPGGGGSTPCESIDGGRNTYCTSLPFCTANDGRAISAPGCLNTVKPVCCQFPTATPTPTPRPSCSSFRGGRCVSTSYFCQFTLDGRVIYNTSCSGSNPVCCAVPTATPTPTPTPVRPVIECRYDTDCDSTKICFSYIDGSKACLAPYGICKNNGNIRGGENCKSTCSTAVDSNFEKEVADNSLACYNTANKCCKKVPACGRNIYNLEGCFCGTKSTSPPPDGFSGDITQQQTTGAVYCQPGLNCVGRWKTQAEYDAEIAGGIEEAPFWYEGVCTSGAGPVTQRFDISGSVFIDFNSNRHRDTEDTGYQGAVLSITGPGLNTTKTTDQLGNFRSYNNQAGAYTIRLTVPQNSQNTTPISKTITLGPSSQGNIFGIAPTYTISGAVFEDVNGNKVKDAGDVDYTKGGFSITSNGGTVPPPNQAQGTYTVTNLLAGTYIVSFVPPQGYFMSAPKPPQFSVTVGPNVTNLDFAIRKSGAWMQSYGFDVRFDSGYTNIIPANPDYPPYAAVVDTR